MYGVWWVFDTDTFPPSTLLTFSHHGGILSWWEYAGSSSSYHRPHESHHPSYEMCKWSRREWERERLQQCTHTYRQRKNFKPSMIMMICVHCTYIHVSTENSTLDAGTKPGQKFQHRTLIMILLRIAAISIDFIIITAIIIITTAPHLNTKQ